ncbi:MAG: thioredoxin family protein [Cyclobacteriaceae bacterium]|nr:thioredoxin family protein [Cyclobacteriaceae bacterium]
MKRLVYSLLIFFFSLPVAAQVLEPAQWAVSSSSSAVKAGDVADIRFTVTIDKNWYLYSNEFPCEDGPMKATFSFTPHGSYELVGGVVAVNPIAKRDDIFDCDVKIFKGKGEFIQKVRLLGSPVKISGSYEYQVCSDVDGKCIPFDDVFSITNIQVAGGVTAAETLPASNPIPISGGSNPITEPAKGPVLDKSILEGEATIREESLIGYLLFAFILGLTSLITPCVFPMVPMTVTFFLRDNQSKKEGIRKALIFGVSIILIYTLAGTLFAVLLGAEGLNALATHWAPNLFVFVTFIIFALSFFGLFEINAPYKLVNKADQQAEKGGLIGIFFMATTLVLVSFSCTLPIVGNVVVLAAGGQITKPILAMFSYSLAFSIPFTLFAIFPEWIKGLPKSGGWLNSVKVTLGFLELALCLKFFSIADQAYHWGLLDRDLNLALWVVIFGLLGIYLLGKLPMKGDTPVEHVTVPRLLLSTLVFSFVVYLIPGLWGAPLKALAGYLPPMYTHDFNLGEDLSRTNTLAGCDPPKYADFLHLPHGLTGYFDYQQALACAREQKKPLFIDFTGHGCTNCREMEAVVWSDPKVLQTLREDYVIVALYVDDKTELPEKDWYVSVYDGKEKKTIGKQNADLQIRNLDNNAQPFYVLVGADERVLAWPYGYNRDPVQFKAFLDRGKAKYNALYP